MSKSSTATEGTRHAQDISGSTMPSGRAALAGAQSAAHDKKPRLVRGSVRRCGLLSRSDGHVLAETEEPSAMFQAGA